MQEQSNSLPHQITIKQRARYPCFVYLVEECDDASIILDMVFEDSYKRWGGIKTIIVPVIRGIIEEKYLEWIRLFDPDVIYTYAILNQETINRLTRENSPFSFFSHSYQRRERKEYPTSQSYFRPSYDFNFVTSLSLAPSIVGHIHPRYSGQKYLLRKHIDSNDCFIADNFGFFDSHLARETVKNHNELQLLSLRSDNPRSRCDLDGDHVSSARQLLEEMTKWGGKAIYTSAYFSGKGTESPWVPMQKIKIFVGDSFDDRLNFWNSRHHYQENDYFNPSYMSIRLPEEKMQDKEFIDEFKKYLGKGGNVRQCSVFSLISYSLHKDQLKELQKALGEKNVCIEEPAPIFPNFDALREEALFQDWTEHEMGRKEESLSISEPYHFEFIKENTAYLKVGEWVTDLEIERHNNLSFVSNYENRSKKEKQIWKIPRNSAITQAFIPKEIGRINLCRNISFIKKQNIVLVQKENKITIKLPNDKQVFDFIFKNKQRFPIKDFRNTKEPIYWYISTSDKGKSLKRIVNLFGGLFKAFCYMDDSLWQSILMEHSTNKDSYISKDLLSIKINSHPIFSAIKGKKSQKRYREEKISELNFLVENKIFLEKDTSQERDYKYHPSSELAHCFQEIWTLGKLLRSFPYSFYYLPQTDIHYNCANKDDKNEVDLICVCDGKLIIGEIKNHIKGFDGKTIDKLIKIARAIQPDIILMAYVDDSGEESSISELKEKIKLEGFGSKIVKIFFQGKL